MKERITQFVTGEISRLFNYCEEKYNDPPSNRTIARVAIRAVRKYDRLKNEKARE